MTTKAPDPQSFGGIENDFQDYKDHLPEEYHEIFDELVGAGMSPSGVAAAIEYVATASTQQEAAEKWDSSKMTIRTVYKAVLALGGRDEVHPNKSAVRLIDLVEDLADELGWEKGREYTVYQSYSGDTPQPSLNKSGIASIHDALIRDGDSA